MSRKRKIPKEKKRLIKEFGLNPSSLGKRVVRVDDLIKDTPNYICFRSNSNFQMVSSTGKTLTFLKGHEYVTTLSEYELLSRQDHFRKNVEPAKRTFLTRFKRYLNNDLTDKKVLVWRYGGLGDLFMIQPLIQYLKDKYPTCKVYFATSPDNLDVFKLWPENLVDYLTIIPFDAELLDICDYHITFEGSLERCNECRYETGCRMYAKMAGVDLDESKYYPVIKIRDSRPELRSELKKLIGDKRFVILHFKSSTINRSIADEVVVRIVNPLLKRGFVVGLSDSYDRREEIQRLITRFKPFFFENGRHIINLAEYSKDLIDCANILDLSEGVITVDTSILHMSPALKKPTVGVYTCLLGSTKIAAYRYAAKIDWYDVATRWNGCGKCPCFYLGFELNKCPFISNKLLPGCIFEMDPLEIVNKLLKLLGDPEYTLDEDLVTTDTITIKDIYIQKSCDTVVLFEGPKIRQATPGKLETETYFGTVMESMLLPNSKILDRKPKPEPYFDQDLTNKSILISSLSKMPIIHCVQNICKSFKHKFKGVKIGVVTDSLYSTKDVQFWNDGLYDAVYEKILTKQISDEYDYYICLDMFFTFLERITSKIDSSDYFSLIKNIYNLEEYKTEPFEFDLNKIASSELDQLTKKHYDRLRSIRENGSTRFLFLSFTTPRGDYFLETPVLLRLLIDFFELNFRVISCCFNQETAYYQAIKNAFSSRTEFLERLDFFLVSDLSQILKLMSLSDIVLTSNLDTAYFSASLNLPFVFVTTSKYCKFDWYNKKSIYNSYNDCKYAPCGLESTDLLYCPDIRTGQKPKCRVLYPGTETKLVNQVVELLDQIEKM